MPTFSIVVPIYNVENYIRQSLDSIQNQTYKDFEVLCVDDCGTDGSMKIAEEFAQKDSRFKILHHEHNRGVSAARNTALDAAKGKYMASVDPDDWVEPTFLQEVFDAFKTCPGAGAVWINGGTYINRTGEYKLKNTTSKPNELLGLNGTNIKYLVGCIWDKVFKLDNIREINIRFPEGLIVEDDEFSFKYFSNYEFVYRVNSALYTYRDDRENSYTNADKTGFIVKNQIKIIYNIYKYTKVMGTFEKYKKYLLEKIAKTVRNVLFFENNRTEILQEAQNLFKQINFPEDYWDMDIK